MADEPNTDGEGYTEVSLILKDELVHSIMVHLSRNEELTRDERGELLNAFIRATGAGS